ncbi:PepSY-associated TM helix domain-containing protein [Pacificimonas flava]|uniref:PepSY-associated TM helix domain-containing protein n=1 Tax=Pacificimonas flava TaxID=1234595 RepID=UPI00098FF4C6|nr:PepSY-associated TM helix domain-containing protein [Pacificimonas flava]MBB5279470.1 putative iron-regulated membrane protein [Pacificimonas flava]
MSWLHGWAGLVLGWLLFAVFLTGTIAYFRQEVTAWMQPELAGSVPSPQAAELAVAALQQRAPDAGSWRIGLPTPRSNTVSISWQDRQSLDVKRGEERGGRGGRGGGRRGGGESLILDASTGAVLTPRKTAGGNFLYRFHFELYALPREWARWIVGLATMAMFVAIISGIITHKKIFKDFFTFRPAKGQRSWLDAHNATAVLSLPFHIMITFSGLLLFASTLLPLTERFAGGEDRRGERGAARALEAAHIESLQNRAASDVAGGAALAPLVPMLAEAEKLWGQPVSRITITDPGRPGAMVELLPTWNDKLIQHSGSGGLGAVKMRFGGRTGERLESEEDLPETLTARVDTALGSLHRARFAAPTLRWLFFLTGVGGTIMVGSGLILWSVKRAQRLRGAPPGRGHRFVDHMNVAGVAGLFIAVAAYFWANRLLPTGLAGRGEWEIRAFFAVWCLCLLHPLIRPLKRAWIEQLSLGGLLFAGIPVLNAITTRAHLGNTLVSGNWIYAGFDIVALVTGICLLQAARRVALHRPRAIASQPPLMPAASAYTAQAAE